MSAIQRLEADFEAQPVCRADEVFHGDQPLTGWGRSTVRRGCDCSFYLQLFKRGSQARNMLAANSSRVILPKQLAHEWTAEPESPT